MSQGAVGASGAPGEAGAEALTAMRAAIVAGRPADVLQACEAVIARATDPAVVVEAVIARAEALAQIGLAADAFGLLRSTRDKERAAGRPGGAAKLSMAESALHMAAGDMAAAKSVLIEAANDFDDADDTADQIRAQLQLAVAYSMTSQPDDVRQLLAGCLAAAQHLRDPAVLAEVRHQEGSFLAATGADPVESFEDGLQAAERSANPVARIQLRVDLGYALGHRDLNRSAALISEAESIAAALTDLLTGASGLATAAQGWWGVGRAGDSIRCEDQALSRLRELGAGPLLVRQAVVTSDMCTAVGRPEDAQRYLGEAIAVGGQIGGPGGEASAMVMLGQAAAQRGDQMAAQQAFRDAVNRLQAAGLPVPPQLSAAVSGPSRPG
jgi:tetratricopeptide (TPR) repeat protein